jgi:hypothetical protein
LLDLGSEANQDILARVRCAQLDTDRQAFRRPMQRQADGRLPSEVEK